MARMLGLAWALAVAAAVAAAAQTSPKALAESTDARNALTLALPNASMAAGNASTTKSPQHRLARTPTQRHSPPSSGARSRSRLDLFRSPSAVLRGLSSRTIVDSSHSVGSGTAESISLAPAPADDLWANSPPGSRTNASTPREVSWTDPEAVERRHITLQPALPKEPSPDRTLRV